MRASFIVMLLVMTTAGAADADDLAGRARAFFSDHCSTCHDADTKKGGLDLASLPWKPNDARIFDRWVAGLRQGRRAEDAARLAGNAPTPPPGPSFLEELRAELRAANRSRQRTDGRVVLRRLNRVEYENTLHDLLAIDLPLQHHLPEDATTNGFDNVALGLRLSMLQMEHYLEAADAAISAAMEFRRRPEGIHKRLRYHDEESVRDDIKKKDKKTFRVLPDAVVIFDDNSPTVLRQWIVPTRGRYRIRISASRVPGRRTAGLAEAVRHGLQDPALARLLRHAGRHAAHDGGGRQPRGRRVAQPQPVRHQLRRSGPTQRLLGHRRRDLSRPRDRHRVGRGRRPLGRSLAAAQRRPPLRRSSGRSGRVGEESRVRPPGPDLRDRAGRPAIVGGAGVAGIRGPRVPAPRHVGRRRALTSSWRTGGSTTA